MVCDGTLPVQPSKKGLTTKGDAMSEMLLDMEADQVTASSIEKMDNDWLE